MKAKFGAVKLLFSLGACVHPDLTILRVVNEHVIFFRPIEQAFGFTVLNNRLPGERFPMTDKEPDKIIFNIAEYL